MKLAIIAALFAAQPVAAQEQCGPSEAVYQFLYTEYGMQRVASGITARGDVAVEMWVGIESQSWVWLVSNDNGETCFVAGGKEWAVYEPKEGDPA